MKYPRGKHPNSRKNTPFVKGHKIGVGRIFTEERKRKISESKIGKPSGMLGKKQSKKTRFKISLANKGKKHLSQTLEKHYNWQGGISKKKGYRAFIEHRRRAKKFKNGGSHTIKQWNELKIKCNFVCPCCGKSEPEIRLTQDHIIPLSKGGSDNIENIQPLCGSCNCRKKVKDTKYVQ